MRLTENYIKQDSTVKNYTFKADACKLKYDYSQENVGQVKTYKLNKEELEEYLKKFK